MSEDDLAIDVLVSLMDGIESGVAAARQLIKERKLPAEEKHTATVLEETFTVLSYDKGTGDKLREFETASRKNNLPDKFDYAYHILRNANATIAHRYHGETYVFNYWIYGDRIFRQLLK
jgi:hypothetical protein